MKKAVVLKTIGSLLLLTAGTMIVPLVIALAWADDVPHEKNEVMAFVVSIAAAAIVGLALRLGARTQAPMGVREAFVVVPIGWVVLCAFGALPFYLSDVTGGSFTDAYFETMSGFTTTGASIFSETNPIEELPHGILFWRSLTHWLGGMGIVVLFLAILPSLGTGGYMLMKAELPGVTTDKLQPKVKATAMILWKVYFMLTLAQILLLWPAMNLFDAVCHAFGTLATGGFSTRNGSVGDYGSAYVDVVITVFMFLAGLNFLLHYYALRNRSLKTFWKNGEFRFYVFLLLGAILVVTLSILGRYDNPLDSLRDASFQVVSISSTTGYATADYNVWPNVCRFTLIMLMFIGAMSGSTGGGIKTLRIVILAKYAFREVRKVVRPNAVFSVKFGDQAVEERTLQTVLGFFGLYVGIFVACSILLCLLVDTGDLQTDMETGVSAVVASISNIGPGLGKVGPMGNYEMIPVLGKWILIACMLIGRLEVYSVLILFSPLTWKK